MKKYKLTLIGLSISLIILLCSLVFDFDLFENVVNILETFEKFEIDEIIIFLVIFSIFAFSDILIRQRAQKIEIEKIKIYKAMMSSTEHILNNLLNQVLLYKMTSEETPGFDPEILALYEQTIKEASTQIEALGKITSIDESSIHASVAPQPKISGTDLTPSLKNIKNQATKK